MRDRRLSAEPPACRWRHRRIPLPACPELAVRYLALYVCTPPKNWRGVSIEEAVDQSMQNTIRHQFTEYDQMLLVGVRRKEARHRVQPILDAVIAAWKKRPT
ncbi:DUF2293 domain-containing protein [Brucella endophytica]|uniref:DUF2293 domain-containing protein n=1 Tax=Brucella endophytica TaxID=1963359 RepID=UPI00166EA632|nr:DUF2293 domain-containing protein [Brucella endophytica]